MRCIAFYFTSKQEEEANLLGLGCAASLSLQCRIYHDDRKPLNRWLWAQDRYAVLEVEKLLQTPRCQLSRGDRLRRHTLVAPLAILVYCLIIHRGILDGWAGWYYAFQRVLAEILLSIRLLEAQHASK